MSDCGFRKSGFLRHLTLHDGWESQLLWANRKPVPHRTTEQPQPPVRAPIQLPPVSTTCGYIKITPLAYVKCLILRKREQAVKG